MAAGDRDEFDAGSARNGLYVLVAGDLAETGDG
jgi:hypothetical protein